MELYKVLVNSVYDTPASIVAEEAESGDGYSMAMQLYARAEPKSAAMAEHYQDQLRSDDIKYVDGQDMQEHVDKVAAVITTLHNIENQNDMQKKRWMLGTLPISTVWTAFKTVQEAGTESYSDLKKSMIRYINGWKSTQMTFMTMYMPCTAMMMTHTCTDCEYGDDGGEAMARHA